MLPHVVDPQHVGHAEGGRPSVDRESPGQPLIDRHAAEQPVEEGLAGHAEHDRRIQLAQLAEVREQLEIVLQRLAEADSRVHEHVDAAPPASRHPLGQVVADLRHDVLVARRVLHGPGLAPHVHRDDRRAVTGRDLQHGLAGARDVVDHRGAGGERPVGRFRLRRVDAQRHAEVEPGDALDHRQQARELVLDLDGRGARPGALRADVDQVGALRGHPPRVLDRPVRRVEEAAVREAVRRHVQDAHDQGAFAEGQGVRAAGQVHRRSLRGTGE